MDLTLRLSIFMLYLLLLPIFHAIRVTRTFSTMQPFCHDDERQALLQFKQSFKVDDAAFEDPSAYPKILSWKLEGERSNCCSWDGVRCDLENGHIIGLDLSSSFLYGSINSSSSLFSLVHLQSLNLADNDFNYSHIPSGIGNLSSLSALNLSSSSFSGQISSEILRLIKLASLDLSDNFIRNFPSFASLSKLTYLSLSSNKITGEIPSSLANLTKLTYIDFSNNSLSGEIPSWLMNLTDLTHIDISSNPMQGPIPSSFSKLKNLEYLDLYSDNLSGRVEASIFLNLKKITHLQLSHNRITFLDTNNSNATNPQFKFLGLSTCNARKFPYFLRFQDKLEHLFLDENHIEGLIPEWVWNKSKETLDSIWLSYNFITGFGQNPVVLPWDRLRVLDINFNMLQGSLPIPPPTTLSYSASDNKLTGEIPPLLCTLNSLNLLDLSINSLSGTIPSCLGNFSDDLMILSLKGNNFRGTIPQIYIKRLRLLDLSQNILEGLIPRSLADCTMLEVLDLGNNQIEGAFPLWSGNLSDLQVLILRSNKLCGTIENDATNLKFPKLRIIDLSANAFTGNLPLGHFQNCKPIIIDVGQLSYMETKIILSIGGWTLAYEYTMTITSKGIKMLYEKISTNFNSMDFSGNKFSGKIPESIGNLNRVQLLNFSNNDLSGGIPPSLGNLTELESLDLSQNKLSGEIPQQLAELGFLSIFNVSYNQLTGPIPHGKQFDTFENNSFQGNLALDWQPLSNRFGDSEKSPPLSSEQASDDSEFLSVVDWIFIVMGFGSGLIVGVYLGKGLTNEYQKRFTKGCCYDLS